MKKKKIRWKKQNWVGNKKFSNIIKMPQTGGKPVKKSSSISKRHFTVVVGTKEHGLYCSSSPSSAARKVVSKLCGKKNGKKVEFCLREITQGSKKKTYGPYLGHVEKLAKPIQLKGRLVERKPVVELLKEKSSVKKGGMRGGEISDITISLGGNCGRSSRFGFWKNGCITLIHGEKKVVLYYNEITQELEVRDFDTKNKNVYNNAMKYKLDDFNNDNTKRTALNNILSKFGFSEDIEFELKQKFIKNIIKFINNNVNFSNILDFLNKLVVPTPMNLISTTKMVSTPSQENQEKQIKYPTNISNRLNQFKKIYPYMYNIFQHGFSQRY